MQIFRTKGQKLIEIEEICEGAWVHMEAPTNEEIKSVCETIKVDEDFLRAALDDEERARIELDEDNLLVVMDIPVSILEKDGNYSYSTVPMGVIIADDVIVTVCLKNTGLIRDFINGRVKNFHTNKRPRFTLQLMYMSAAKFLQYLRDIDKISTTLEQEIYDSTKNSVLIQMMKLEKSLVYFSTALKGNEVVFERLMRVKLIKQYPEDSEILDDVIIENKQAMEMCIIYREILSGMMDAIGSIISNNLNMRMKMLTSITIVIAIPTFISSVWGMNVWVPFQDSGKGFVFVCVIMAVMTFATGVWMGTKNMF
jgi:magnesium transporter